MTKPILSTPTMKQDEGWYGDGDAGSICMPTLCRLFGIPWRSAPRAIRLHAYGRAGKARKRIRLRGRWHTSGWWEEVFATSWTSSATGSPRSNLSCDFEDWLAAKAPFADRLKKGETVTIYVSLEVIKT